MTEEEGASWAAHYNSNSCNGASLKSNGSATQADLSWTNLSWFAEVGATRKQILHNLPGNLPCGQLMAVMGPSGSGKTTLLDILAMRKTVGRIEGAVRVNGQERRPRQFQRASAFILQEDVSLPTLTVNETMWYFAEMMLPQRSMGKMQRETCINEVLQLVGLAKARNTFVGGAVPGGYGMRGLSSGERKRLSIAAAMLNKPVLVFADEPTSGIDAFASLRVVEVLKDLATKGRTVIVTLHQPRDAVWRLFDQLYLLSEGHLVYAGKPTDAVPWFASLGLEAPPNVSISDWLLDVVAVGYDKSELEWKCLRNSADVENAASRFAESPWLAEVREEVSRIHARAVAEGRDRQRWPAQWHYTEPIPRWVQARALLVRHVLNYARNISNVLARLLLALTGGLLVGVCYSGLRGQDPGDSSSLKNRFGALFFCSLFMMLSPNCSMGLFVANRRFYSVEAAAHLYQSTSYYAPLALCEFIVNVLAAGLFWTPFCLLTGAGQRSLGGYWSGLLACALMQLCGAQIVNFAAMLLPNQELAFVLSVAVNVAAFITAGFLIKTNNLPWTAGWIRFFSPMKFGFHALAVNEVMGKSFDEVQHVDRMHAALRSVGTDGCAREGVEISPLVAWCLQRPQFERVSRGVLTDILANIDPCLFETVRDGQEALECLQLNEPSSTELWPSFLVMLIHLVVLHLAGWLCLRYLHKEQR